MLKICGLLLALVVGSRSLLAGDMYGPIISEKCKRLFLEQGVNHNFNETIAHAIHSMTVQGLKLFNSKATVHNNHIPTMNQDLTSPVKVLAYAPNDPLGYDFYTRTMNVLDHILQAVGTTNDTLGPNWSPIERVIHNLHMWDLWDDIANLYHGTVSPYPPGQEFCDCLTDTGYNGIYKAVQWIADHFAPGPNPELTDGVSWGVWKKKLVSRFYHKGAVHDAALFLYCELKDL